MTGSTGPHPSSVTAHKLKLEAETPFGMTFLSSFQGWVEHVRPLLLKPWINNNNKKSKLNNAARRETLFSNQAQETGYSVWCLCDFPQTLPGEVGLVSQIRPWPILFVSFVNYFPLVILSFISSHTEMLTPSFYNLPIKTLMKLSR
jgi:hypothetical protein